MLPEVRTPSTEMTVSALKLNVQSLYGKTQTRKLLGRPETPGLRVRVSETCYEYKYCYERL